MKRTVPLLLAVGLAAFAAGWLLRRPEAPPAPPPRGRTILYWHDPMHPAYRSDHPGVAPDCGMQLEPVYADAAPAEAAGTVTVDPAQQQLIGVRLGSAEKSGGRRQIRCVGRVAADEGRVSRVSAGVEGWIRRVDGGATGSVVRRDQPLVVISSRDLLTPQQAYLYALDGQDRLKDRNPDAQQLALSKNQLELALQGLEAIGLTGPALRTLERTRTATREIELASPSGGVVVHRNAEVGQRFERNAELFRIADLTRVWVLADVYPQDAAFVAPGQAAILALPANGRRLPARVSVAPPQFDAGSRTLKVRLELDNPKLELRPEMVVDVELEVVLPDGIVVPAEAVLDSGTRAVVYVDRGAGRFEPRPVETGWRAGDRVEIKSGLAAGERIVLSGQFLLDSESRLRATPAPPSAP